MSLFNLFTKKSPRNERTANDLQQYLSQRYELLKLELLEKSSQIISVILSMIIVVVCALAVFIYLSNAFVSWLTLALNEGWAYTIVCAIYIIIVIVVFRHKDTLFVKPMIRKLSRILYAKKKNDIEEAEVIDDTAKKGGAHE